MPETKQGPAAAAPAAEPLSAILAEMRADRCIPHHIDWADRIEAAAEREREINQKILAAANDANAILKDDRDRAIQFANAAPHPGSVSWKEMHEVYAKARAILSAVPKEGNAAAMCAALGEIVLLTLKAGMSLRSDVACGIIRSKARHALSAPPRNCDVGTAEEQAERFNQFCLDNHSAEHLCSRCPLGKQLGNDADMCQLHWAQMPYVPAEGGAE